jgi:hypothetical protein
VRGAVFTKFRSLECAHGERFRLPWAALFKHMQTARVIGGQPIPRVAYATFRGNHRSNDDHEATYAMGVDIDRGNATSVQIEDGLGDLFGFYHLTKSSRPGELRWRVITPLSRPVTTAEHPRVWRWLAALVERAGLEPDYAAKDAARVWAIPVQPRAMPYVYGHLRGAFLDVERALAEMPEEQPLPAPEVVDESVERRIVRARAYLRTLDPALQGSHGSTACFRAALVVVRGYALPLDVATTLVTEYSDEKARPRFTPREIAWKVRSAHQFGRVPFGYLLQRRSA